MKNKRQFYLRFILAVFLGLTLNLSAFASSAICTQVENDPASKHQLNPPPSHIDGSEALIYKSIDGVDLRLHVFEAIQKQSQRHLKNSKKPVILFFFGGAWEYGSVNELIEPAKYFSERGVVSVLVDYRVFCRNGSSIADEISDAKSAVRYIRSHASKFGIDPNRIAVAGASAGGHLALSTATIEGFETSNEDKSISSKPNLLALFYPCSDVTTDEEKMYGGDAIGTYGKEVSPLYHVRQKLPPTLIIQGTDDIVYEENKKFCSESNTFGNTCEFIVYKGAQHGFFSADFNNGKWYRQALKKMAGFLTNVGYLKYK